MNNGTKKTLKKKVDDDPVIERSSGNVFADLGYPNLEEAFGEIAFDARHCRFAEATRLDPNTGR